MKKISIIAGCLLIVVAMISCNNVRRSPGRVYMPDMAYSRAYETYASTEALDKAGIHYTSMPVEGTVARGDMYAYTLKNDSAGYALSAANKSPLNADSAGAKIDMKEAERLYLIYCGICHGDKLDGNGPLWKGGDGPFPNKPATLVGDAVYEAMTEGTMFHSLTYGKNSMGSYASQLNTKQRWEVIAYIKSKQGAASAKKPAADSTKTTTVVKTGK
jgi:mono/diheme cytochrome c family protein